MQDQTPEPHETQLALFVNEILMRAVVQAAAFLELSSDDTLDPDVAVSQLEGMAYRLSQLGDAERISSSRLCAPRQKPRSH